MKSVGLNPMASIDMYKEVVREGYVLISKIDENKMRNLKTLKRFISTREFITGIVTGLITGLFSGYLLLLILP